AELSLGLSGWGIAAPTIFLGEQVLSANAQRWMFSETGCDTEETWETHPHRSALAGYGAVSNRGRTDISFRSRARVEIPISQHECVEFPAVTSGSSFDATTVPERE